MYRPQCLAGNSFVFFFFFFKGRKKLCILNKEYIEQWPFLHIIKFTFKGDVIGIYNKKVRFLTVSSLTRGPAGKAPPNTLDLISLTCGSHAKKGNCVAYMNFFLRCTCSEHVHGRETLRYAIRTPLGKLFLTTVPFYSYNQ